MRDAARNLLAWENINDDEDTKKRVDPAQLKLMERNLAGAKRDLDETIFRAYQHVFLLGKDNKLQHVDLSTADAFGPHRFAERAVRFWGNLFAN